MTRSGKPKAEQWLEKNRNRYLVPKGFHIGVDLARVEQAVAITKHWQSMLAGMLHDYATDLESVPQAESQGDQNSR